MMPKSSEIRIMNYTTNFEITRRIEMNNIWKDRYNDKDNRYGQSQKPFHCYL